MITARAGQTASHISCKALPACGFITADPSFPISGMASEPSGTPLSISRLAYTAAGLDARGGWGGRLWPHSRLPTRRLHTRTASTPSALDDLILSIIGSRRLGGLLTLDD